MQVGAYQVLFELARGGMGTVFLARAVGAGGFERLVAIKRAHAGAGVDAAATERFLSEARVAAQVHHANVVSTHLADADAEGHFLVCDYVEGASLAQLIERLGARGERIPAAIALRIVADALAGLHAVHEASSATGEALGILHRDVSAQNLLVGRDGVTRLSDFGIARSATSGAATDQLAIMGKLVYLAPEYLQRLPVGRSLDIYALGIVLWIALSGCDPWDDMADAQLLEQITLHGVPAFSRLGLGLDPTIEQVVERACRREACWRYQTAREMLDALEQAGNKTGCLASQRAVAEYVEQVFGDELGARRERIRARSHELAADNQPVSQQRAGWERWRNWVVAFGLGGLALLLGLLYSAAQKPTLEPRVTSATSLEHVAPKPCEGAACAAAADRSSEAPRVLPATSAPATAGSAATTAPLPAATRKRLRRAADAARSPTNTATPMPKVAPFGRISTVNPYRKPAP